MNGQTKTGNFLIPLLVACMATSCSVHEERASAPAVTIMTFNVENLFDNRDDPGKVDETYLALAAKQNSEHIAACNTIEVDSWRDQCLNLDWNDDTIAHKLSVLAGAIRQTGDGCGADIIALQEIENRRILERLRKDFLSDCNYQPAVLIEGSDVRGIDVAFLSKLPIVGEARLHPLFFADYPDREGDTRGVLEATFRLPDGTHLTGFSVHFPAPFHPREMRETAYRHLQGLLEALPANRHTFAGGDFNTTSREDREHAMLDRLARPHWQVAHDQCVDCRGTQYYARDDSWSFLDMILFAPPRSEKATWQIRADSVRVANAYAAQVTSQNRPNRYNGANKTGVSDHWPLLVTIETTQNQ